jgi:hypothetical protein
MPRLKTNGWNSAATAVGACPEENEKDRLSFCAYEQKATICALFCSGWAPQLWHPDAGDCELNGNERHAL